MPLINCRAELKLRWAKHCVLSVRGAANDDNGNNSNNIIFTINDLKLSDPVCTLSAKNYQNFSAKDLNTVYWHENKTKNEHKNYIVHPIQKLTTGQCKDYTTGCLLDYEYIKNHYRLIAVELSRQKELDTGK